MGTLRKTKSGENPSHLPDGWQRMKLGDAPIEIIDGDRGTNYPKQKELFNQNYCLFLNAKNVTGTGLSFLELNFITKEKDNILRKGKLNRNDVVLTTRGTVGNIAFYHDKVPFENVRINSGMVIIRPNGIDPQFVYQLFKFSKNHFLSFSSGSAQPQLPIKDMQEIPIILPPLPEQKSIAEVLSSLDDKIDLLHRQNKILEDMAQTLFRQWFVEESDDGRGKKNLECIMNISSGKGLKKDEYIKNGDVPVFGANGEIGKTNRFLLDDKIIFTGRVGTLGEIFISHGKAWLSDNTLIIKTAQKYFYFVYFFLKNAKLQRYNKGSTQPLITQSDIKNINFILPTDEKLQKFNSQSHMFFRKTSSNQSQISTLENLRDTLLPKLMRGDMRVNTPHLMV